MDVPLWMRGRITPLTRGLGLGVFAVSSRVKKLGVEHLEHDGPLLLVSSHLCHNDPLLLSIATPRRVDWMARIEFLGSTIGRWLLQIFDAFAIDRFGNALPGIREAIRRLKAGRTIGMFPEGGVKSGGDSVLSGAPIKHGAFLLAQRTGAPVVPCVMLGSRAYLGVVPWLPLKLGRLWVAYGEPIHARAGTGATPAERKVERREMAERTERAMQELHATLVAEFEVQPDVQRV